MSADVGRSGGGAEPQAGAIDGDAGEIRDPLDVDERRRPAQPGADLHQQIGAPGKDARLRVGVDQMDGFGERARSFVTDVHS